jgi:hypothetical protein
MTSDLISLRSPECKTVLKTFNRAVAHLREQFGRAQLGLVFGAGIGDPFGFPRWEDLLSRIAASPEVQGEETLRTEKNPTAQAQQLYQRFKLKVLTQRSEEKDCDLLVEMRLRARWREVVHRCLYEGVPETMDEIISRDEYLISFLDVIRRSPLTVTYNFDDLLERLLARTRTDRDTRGFTTIWSGNAQLTAKPGGVVYHPNGFLPLKLQEKPSDDLVFLENSFADQLIDSIAGYYSSLSAHMAQTTCLFIGLSMGDPTLKHLLRQTAKAFPGHCHYRVAYTPPEKVNPEHQKLESIASFDVYNLITLHLSSIEHKALAKLLLSHKDEFKMVAEEVGARSCFRYMVTGAVGVGKSCLVNHLRSLLTQDEWTEERAPGMEKAPELLTPKETRMIDEWVAEQIATKNLHLMNADTGLHLTDRAPLDAFAFTPKAEWKSKAKLIKSRVSLGKAKGRKLVGAHIILLIGDPEVMAARAISLHKVTDAERLRRQQLLLRKIYEPLGNGVTVVDTANKSIPQVVKECAEIIFFKEYYEADLHGRLLGILKNGYEE